MRYVIAIATITLIAIIVFITYFFKDFPGSDAEVLEVIEGNIESFMIGDSKVNVLQKNSKISISANVGRVKGCTNWLPAKSSQDIIKNCFLASDTWSVTPSPNFCRSNRDQHTDLYFNNGALKKVIIRCTYPI